jgi:hypothetical protein
MLPVKACKTAADALLARQVPCFHRASAFISQPYHRASGAGCQLLHGMGWLKVVDVDFVSRL